MSGERVDGTGEIDNGWKIGKEGRKGERRDILTTIHSFKHSQQKLNWQLLQILKIK